MEWRLCRRGFVCGGTRVRFRYAPRMHIYATAGRDLSGPAAQEFQVQSPPHLAAAHDTRAFEPDPEDTLAQTRAATGNAVGERRNQGSLESAAGASIQESVEQKHPRKSYGQALPAFHFA